MLKTPFWSGQIGTASPVCVQCNYLKFSGCREYLGKMFAQICSLLSTLLFLLLYLLTGAIIKSLESSLSADLNLVYASRCAETVQTLSHFPHLNTTASVVQHARMYFKWKNFTFSQILLAV